MADIANALAEVAAKKKPGRPRKEIPLAKVPVGGVATRPLEPTNIVELKYHHPSLFKDISQLLKKFSVDELELSFCKTELKINALDHLKKSNIYITVVGANMSHYYCEKPVHVKISRKNADRVLDMLDKDVSQISFILREDYRSTLYIIIKCSEYNNDEVYEFNVCCSDQEGITQTHNETQYPLKFTLSSKYFKRKIGNLQKIGEYLNIQKIGGEPLQLGCGEKAPVKWTSTNYDDKLIELQSKLGDGEIMNVSLMINYIKPFSESNIGDKVYIAIDKKERACFSTYLDRVNNGWTCSIKVFTEITDFRTAP